MNVIESFSLKGKVAVITGGAGHLGTAMSEALNEAGAVVAVIELSQEKFDEKFAGKENYFFVQGDISDTENIKKCYQTVFDRYGRIDVLINNAVYLKGGGCLPEQITDEMWAISADGVLGSVFRCIREIIPYMEKNGGSIVNIASMYGVVIPDLSMYNGVCSPYLNPINYGALKAGVIQLTKYFGAYLISKNINVNCVTPGTFPSPKVQENIEFVEKLSSKNPANRIGKPEDLKGAILFLSSNASNYIIGQNIIIDGGWTLA